MDKIDNFWNIISPCFHVVEEVNHRRREQHSLSPLLRVLRRKVARLSTKCEATAVGATGVVTVLSHRAEWLTLDSRLELEIAQGLRCQPTDRKVRGSKLIPVSLLSRLGQPGSISTLVLPSGGMAARDRMGITVERLVASVSDHQTQLQDEPIAHDSPVKIVVNLSFDLATSFDEHLVIHLSGVLAERWLNWLERESTDRKVRGSNPTSASRLALSRLRQPGSIPALVLPSGGAAAKHRKGVTPEQFFCLGQNATLFLQAFQRQNGKLGHQFLAYYRSLARCKLPNDNARSLVTSF
ncbi:hypothetical protein CSKR_110956 [Clonorchis sinensis]|uniref:Uncharacterized protein n=1 Tax=Clonorchis sinensis TaxID=79923 RepID=A0A419PXY2_CLOSI|nr:hypothetical protein CSKR_110956 [Clonorchis sinensis]